MRRLRRIPSLLFLAARAWAGDAGDAWLAKAGLGPHAHPEDMAAIEASARREGALTIWSASGRVARTAKSFEDRYGIAVSVIDLQAQELIAKVREDQAAARSGADIYLFGDAPEVQSTLARDGSAWPWLAPDDEEAIPPELREGLPAHHVSAVGVLYDAASYGEPPIRTWWDLTTPRWRGRVVMKALDRAGGDLNLFAAFVEYADVLASSYEARFGEKLELHGTKNAGYELLKRLIENDPIFTESGSDAAALVLAPKGDRPLLGIMALSQAVAPSGHGLRLAWAHDLKPCAGLAVTYPIAIARGALHPSAATLFIHYALGAEGYEPYAEFGTWPARGDVPASEGIASYAEAGFWLPDPDVMFRERDALLAFVAASVKKQ
ncbi:MAG: ABC transporter substrate-binding protein [Acidobacteriota bacterium]